MNSQTMTDEALVERIRGGEFWLYEVLVDRYHKPLHRVINSILRGDGESEDVMQEAHLRAFTRLHQFRGTARFSTWLHRIAVNQALQYRRSARRYQYVGEDWESQQHKPEDASLCQYADPERQVSADELRASLDTALEALRPGFRAVFVLKEVEHLTTQDIASRLGISEACAKTRLHRAKKQLRRSIGRGASVASISSRRCQHSPSVARSIMEAA